jgi:hypothetical protein
VVFESRNQDVKLTGIISRDVKASSLFKILEISGIQIEIQSEKVVVK